MLFNTFDFACFFVAVYLAYFCLEHRGQNLLLLAASYYFYGRWNAELLGLIAFSTVTDYLCGLALHRSESERTRRRLLLLSVTVNLGLLAVFKYLGFFVESMEALLTSAGIDAGPWRLDLVLPVGISFYTFQTMSYTIDIYRRKLEPTRNFLDFALYVAFFPQLVAGPIERAVRLLPQIAQRRTITWDGVRAGAWLILIGYFKKTVIADNLAVLVDPAFSDPSQANGFDMLTAIYAFALQIYCDFSGYSAIARGLSKLMGIDLCLNFRRPYFSTNPSEFWRRWHISLSTWLRDYLYIPLGGNRGGPTRTYVNLGLTMLLGGLWHGAAWNFVAWGAYQGALLAIHRALADRLERLGAASGVAAALWRVARLVGFFQLTCLGWVLFRVDHLSDVPLVAASILDLIVHPTAPSAALWFRWGWAATIVLPLIAMEIGEELATRRGREARIGETWPWPPRLLLYNLLFAYIALFGATKANAFLYFQF